MAMTIRLQLIVRKMLFLTYDLGLTTILAIWASNYACSANLWCLRNCEVDSDSAIVHLGGSSDQEYQQQS